MMVVRLLLLSVISLRCTLASRRRLASISLRLRRRKPRAIRLLSPTSSNLLKTRDARHNWSRKSKTCNSLMLLRRRAMMRWSKLMITTVMLMI